MEWITIQDFTDWYIVSFEPWLDGLSNGETALYLGLIPAFLLWLARAIYKKYRKQSAPVALIQNETQFSPNKLSPFTTGKAVTPPQFVGRRQELKFLHDSLQKAESISLLGKRRIGKSSLLATWEKSLTHNNYTVIFLNGQKQEGENLQRFIHAITQQQLAQDASADNAADVLVQWAEKQFLATQKKPVILVDECEAIIQQCPHRFWERVRGALAQIIWVFSSKQPLDSLYKYYHHQGSPFENQLKTQWLGLLDADAANAIIRKGDFTQQQQDLLKQWAGCHPFYLQSLADRLWQKKPTTQQEEIEVLDGFKMDAKRHLNDLWQGLTAREQTKLLDYIHKRQAINDSALRCMGIITIDGQPFAKVFLDYLQDKQHD